MTCQARRFSATAAQLCQVESRGSAERLRSPHTREPQSLKGHPEAWTTSLRSPGAAGSSELPMVPCPASCTAKSDSLAPRSAEVRDWPRMVLAGDRPGSLHTLTGGRLLPGSQRLCSPHPGLGVCLTTWPQHTQPSRLVEDTASWSHGHSAVPDQRWASSRGSRGKLDSPAGLGCRRTFPRLGGSAHSS